MPDSPELVFARCRSKPVAAVEPGDKPPFLVDRDKRCGPGCRPYRRREVLNLYRRGAIRSHEYHTAEIPIREIRADRIGERRPVEPQNEHLGDLLPEVVAGE